MSQAKSICGGLILTKACCYRPSRLVESTLTEIRGLSTSVLCALCLSLLFRKPRQIPSAGYLTEISSQYKRDQKILCLKWNPRSYRDIKIRITHTAIEIVFIEIRPQPQSHRCSCFSTLKYEWKQKCVLRAVKSLGNEGAVSLNRVSIVSTHKHLGYLDHDIPFAIQ